MGETRKRNVEISAKRRGTESAIIRLSRDDQAAFAKALIDPPAPNARLVAAKRQHAALIR